MGRRARQCWLRVHSVFSSACTFDPARPFFSTLVLFIFPVKLELLLLTRVCYTADCNVFTLLRSLLLELETWDNSHSHDKFPNQGNIKMKAETTPSHTFPGLCHGVGEQLHICYCYCSRPASYKC